MSEMPAIDTIDARERNVKRRRCSNAGLEDLATQSHKRRIACIIAGPPIAAPFLGGASELWAQAVIAMTAGYLFIACPPSRSLGRIINGGIVLLILFAAIAFLPSDWWTASDWRTQLATITGLALPQTRSPQPWLTFEAFGLMILGLG